MIIWVDAQLSPQLSSWLSKQFSLKAFAIRDLHLQGAKDREIFLSARKKKAVIMTKDSDFLTLLDQQGTPPQVLWITCGNTSNAYLKEILCKHLPKALQLLASGERLVEISDTPQNDFTILRDR